MGQISDDKNDDVIDDDSEMVRSCMLLFLHVIHVLNLYIMSLLARCMTAVIPVHVFGLSCFFLSFFFGKLQ